MAFIKPLAQEGFQFRSWGKHSLEQQCFTVLNALLHNAGGVNNRLRGPACCTGGKRDVHRFVTASAWGHAAAAPRRLHEPG